MNKHNFIKVTPFILILLNFTFKILFVSVPSIGGDEPFSIYHAQMDVPSIIRQLSSGNNPPLYEIFLHFWIKIFGISEFSVRFPSVLFSALAVLFLYKIGKEFFSYEVGLFAGLLFTFSNFNLLLAHEARVYGMFSFFTAASMYYFLAVIRSPNAIKNLILLLIINTILVYLHYFGFFIISVQTLVILISKDFRQYTIKKYSLYFLLLIILYIPNLRVLVQRFLDSSINGTWIRSPDGFNSIYNMLRTFSNQPITTLFSIVVLSLALLIYFIRRNQIENNPNKKVILIWFLFPFVFMFVISYWIPMFFDRYLIFVSLGYYLSIAIAVFSIFSRDKYNYILAGIVVLLFGVTFNPNMDNKRHVKETVSKIVELKYDNTSVIICPSNFALNFSYYYQKDIFSDVDATTVYSKMFDNLNNENIYPINTINMFSAQSKRIVFLDAAASFSFPDNNIYNTLNEKYKLINTYKFYEIFTLYEFEQP